MKKILGFVLVALLFAVPAFADNVLPPSTKDVPNGYKATLQWTASTTATDGTALTPPVTYSVYAVTTTTQTKLQSGVAALTYVTPNLTAVGLACWDITATALSTEGGFSNIVCVNVLPVPPPIPNAPTNLGVKSVGPTG